MNVIDLLLVRHHLRHLQMWLERDKKTNIISNFKAGRNGLLRFQLLSRWRQERTFWCPVLTAPRRLTHKPFLPQSLALNTGKHFGWVWTWKLNGFDFDDWVFTRSLKSGLPDQRLLRLCDPQLSNQLPALQGFPWFLLCAALGSHHHHWIRICKCLQNIRLKPGASSSSSGCWAAPHQRTFPFWQRESFFYINWQYVMNNVAQLHKKGSKKFKE